MSDGDKTEGMKSAYELALERLEQQGIDRPSEDSLSPQTRQAIAELRSQTEAKLAQLEILHQDRIKSTADPAAAAQADEDYTAERRRLEEKLEHEIEKLRTGS